MRKKINLPWPISAILFALILLSGFGLLNALGSRPPESASREEWRTVTHELYGFSLDYPPRWLADTYDEYGSRGDRELKALIHRGFAGTVYVVVYYKPGSKPQLEDVVKWGFSRNPTLRSANTDILSFQEMELNGYKIAKRTYRSTNTYQDVYIARENDMIIIKLQAEEIDFWDFLVTFDEIVSSFRPMY